jgi:peroxiredoxin
MELQVLEAAQSEFEKLGASLVALSTKTGSNSRKSARQNKLTFQILFDAKGAVGAAFGLRFQLPDSLIELYKSLKNDMPAFNGDTSWTLPMSGRYVIGGRHDPICRSQSRLHVPPGTGRHAASAAPGGHEPRRVRSIE